MRSHIHMNDICDFYRLLLKAPKTAIEGEVFNAVAENLSVDETAQAVGAIIPCSIHKRPRMDNRSYTVDGAKARKVLGFEPKRRVGDAVKDLKIRFDSGMWKDSETNEVYQNLAQVWDEVHV